MALGAVIATSAALTACGEDESIPGDSVARFQDSTIKKSEYDKALADNYKQVSLSNPAAPKTISRPPNFTTCVAAATKAQAKQPKAQRQSPAAIKTGCRTQYEQLREQTMGILLQNEWLEAELDRRDIEISDKDIDAEIAKTRKQFPGKGAFEKALKAQGKTLADEREETRSRLATQKVIDDLRKEQPAVTAAQVSAYYKKNRSKFAKPETRDLRVISTDSKAKAEAARSALAGGQSWKTVSQRYTTDAGLKSTGGVVADFPKPAAGQAQSNGLDRGLTDAIFSAKVGELKGPIKAQLGYFVVQVQKIQKPAQQTEKQAAAQIRTTLKDERFAKVFEQFKKDYEKRWKAETKCRDGYEMELCDGVKKKPVPQQQAPQQIPQPGN